MMYAISVTGGKEFQVFEELKKIDGIKALLPTNMIVIRKAGIWREKEKVLIPGYIFIKCKFNYDLYYKVKSIPCVTSWIGKGVPSVMSIEDESFIERDYTDKEGEKKVHEFAKKKLRDNEYKVYCALVGLGYDHPLSYEEAEKALNYSHQNIYRLRKEIKKKLRAFVVDTFSGNEFE